MIFVSPSCVKQRYVMSNPFFMKADRHLWPSNWVPLATNIISTIYIRQCLVKVATHADSNFWKKHDIIYLYLLILELNEIFFKQIRAILLMCSFSYMMERKSSKICFWHLFTNSICFKKRLQICVLVSSKFQYRNIIFWIATTQSMKNCA